jgi:hypothetical protein
MENRFCTQSLNNIFDIANAQVAPIELAKETMITAAG